jgi:hypothetical protein
MPLRRAALLATAASTLTALTALGTPAAVADPAPTATGPATGTAAAAPAPTRADLYGAADPTYDGVWRQSYAIRAVTRSGYLAGSSAIGWLLAQQCADGGWPSYRADTAKSCDPKTEDTNATAEAIDALLATQPGGAGRQALDRGQAWLRKVRNADGGWSYNPGGPSDPDSTALALGALGQDAAGQADAKGKTPYDALRGFQFGCAAKPAARGAFGYPGTDGKLTPNAKATADALSGMAQANLTTTAARAATAPPTRKAPDCAVNPAAYATLDPQSAASAAADWLAAQLRAGGGHLNASAPGSDKPTPDYGTTADAVVALAALRPADAKAAYTWLTANAGSWAKGNPAALAQLIVACDAVHGDRTLAGADPLQQLIALGPAPTKRPTGAETHAEGAKDDDASSSSTTWIIVGVVFVASAGAGILLSGRKRRRN